MRIEEVMIQLYLQGNQTPKTEFTRKILHHIVPDIGNRRVHINSTEKGFSKEKILKEYMMTMRLTKQSIVSVLPILKLLMRKYNQTEMPKIPLIKGPRLQEKFRLNNLLILRKKFCEVV